MIELKDIKQEQLYKVSPNGIDILVDRIQKLLFGDVLWLDLAFGRIYKNTDKDGNIVPEVYLGDNEYMEVFPDDTITTSFSFVETEDITDVSQEFIMANIKIIFFVNLDKAFDLPHRGDSEAVMEVYQALSEDYEITKLIRGIKNVYSEYGFKPKQNLVDMQPYFCFAVELEHPIDLNDCIKTC